MLAMVVMTGAMAQNNTGATQWGAADQEKVGDYVRQTVVPPVSNTAYDPASTPSGLKVTIGATMPFWVWPSALYNPNFDYTGTFTGYRPAGITTGVTSSFEWRVGDWVTDATATATAFESIEDQATGGSYTNKNYVEIPFSALGNKLIQVIEEPTAAICPGLPVWFDIKVINEPWVRFDPTTLIAYDNIEDVLVGACDGDASLTGPTFTVILDNGDEVTIGTTELSRYHINFGLKVINYDINPADGTIKTDTGVDITSTTNTLELYGFNKTAAVSTANPFFLEGTTFKFIYDDAGTDKDLEFIVQNNKVTVYEISLGGWNAGISRNSDYLKFAENNFTYADDKDQFTYYSGVDATVAEANRKLTARIVAMPAPVTGPIYHIPNNYAF